jgi:hypothetical protein
MTHEQELLAQRVAEEIIALKAAMSKLPFDFNTAGSTRVEAWRMAHSHAHQVLNRKPAAVAPYAEARIRLLSCGTADIEALAKEMWG